MRSRGLSALSHSSGALNVGKHRRNLTRLAFETHRARIRKNARHDGGREMLFEAVAQSSLAAVDFDCRGQRGTG